MQGMLDQLLKRLSQGENAVLCTVLSSHGSTPRGAGAKMAVFADGETVGTIGGGAAELKAIQSAVGLCQKKKSAVVEFIMTPNQVADLGMICGGQIRVLLQFLDASVPENLQTIQRLLTLLQGRQPAWLKLVVHGNCVTEFEAIEERGSSDRADRNLLTGETRLLETDVLTYMEPMVQSGRVYIFGCGHVSKALTPILSGVGFRVTVMDSRQQLATRESFPTAEEIILGDFAKLERFVTLKKYDYAIVMTPAHTADFEVLEQVMRTPVCYIGCIGSKTKVAKTKERLLEVGIPQARIEDLHAPIGLMIGAETPEEIAISIAAQLIQVRKAQRGTERHATV